MHFFGLNQLLRQVSQCLAHTLPTDHLLILNTEALEVFPDGGVSGTVLSARIRRYQDPHTHRSGRQWSRWASQDWHSSHCRNLFQQRWQQRRLSHDKQLQTCRTPALQGKLNGWSRGQRTLRQVCFVSIFSERKFFTQLPFEFVLFYQNHFIWKNLFKWSSSDCQRRQRRGNSQSILIFSTDVHIDVQNSDCSGSQNWPVCAKEG